MRNVIFVVSVAALLLNGVAIAGGGSVGKQLIGKRPIDQLVGKAMKVGATVFAITALACAGLTGCGEGDEVGKMVDDGTEMMMETFKIGLTYDADLDGSLKGAQLAVQQINEGGGINGQQVELLPRDNQRNTDVSYSTVKGLVENDQVYAVTGPDYSTQAAAINGFMQSSMTPLVTAGATNPNVGAAGNYVFMASFADDFQGLVMAKLAADEYDAKSAAVFYLDGDVYSKGLAEAFTESFASLGGEVSVTIAYPLYTPDGGHKEFVATLNAELGAVVEAQPDVVFIPGFTFGSRESARLAREAGVSSHFLGADGWSFGGPILGDNGEYAEVLEGAKFSEHFSADAEEGVTPQGRQFVVDYTVANGMKPNAVAAVNYDAVWLVALAAQDVDPGLTELSDIRSAIRDGIAATNNYNGATTIFNFNASGHPSKSAVINVIRGGEVVVYKIANP